MDHKKFTKEEMLAEARAFQREVGRNTDRRGFLTPSNMAPSGRGLGSRGSKATHQVVPHQPVQKLATPEQLFGRPTILSPAHAGNAPVIQQPTARPAEKGEPMQIDPRPDVPRVNKPAAKPAGDGLVASRWATSSIHGTVSPTNLTIGSHRMEVDTDSRVSTQDYVWNDPSNKPGSSATLAGSIKDASNAGVTMKEEKGFPLDTPKASDTRKGLLSSRWAMPSPASPSAQKYPDPATLEPVYRTENWLADLSKEYETLSVKAKVAVDKQPAQSAPSWKAAAQTTEPPNSRVTSQPERSARVNFPSAQAYKTVQSPSLSRNQTPDRHVGPSPAVSTGRSAGQPVQEPNSNASAAHQRSRAPASAQAAIDQSPIPTTNTAGRGNLTEPEFMDWYKNHFMGRKS